MLLPRDLLGTAPFGSSGQKNSIDTAKVTAELEKGILRINAQKERVAKVKQISIAAA